MLNIVILEKGLGLGSPSDYTENVCHVTFS